MVLGLEPGYPGQDDRLDKSVLAAAVAILGAGMSFLFAMVFLVFPSWISPREFAVGVRVFAASIEVLSPPAVTELAEWTSAPVQHPKAAFTTGPVSDPSDETFFAASRAPANVHVAAENRNAPVTAVDTRRSERPEREVVAGPVAEPNESAIATPRGPENPYPESGSRSGDGSGRGKGSEHSSGKHR
ncbi:MAG: hypothetical protein ACRDFA_02875 [bacterium]